MVESRFVKFVVIMATIVVAIFGFIYFTNGPNLGRYDHDRIYQEAVLVLSDATVPMGSLDELSIRYEYLNSIGKNYFKSEDGLLISVWSFWVEEKGFFLFSPTANVHKITEMTRKWRKVDGLLYSYHEEG